MQRAVEGITAQVHILLDELENRQLLPLNCEVLLGEEDFRGLPIGGCFMHEKIGLCGLLA